MNQENEYFNEDFQHGYETGVENVEKSTYEAYLGSHTNFEWLEKRIDEKREEVAKINTDIEAAISKRQTSFEKLQTYLMGISTHNQKVVYLKDVIAANLQRIEKLEARIADQSTPYSLFAGILYLLAGIAFVTGDLIISHEIVAYALNIRDNYEAWAFAIGLAMLSVLLKPAYERLVEQPYLREYSAKTKRIYGIFQGFLMVFAIGTMIVLGWFRYEAYKTDKLKDGINKQIKAMQLESQPLDPTMAQPANNQALVQKIDEQLKAYNKLNIDLVSSPWAMLSFVLSGVLFAVAGAICLGIAFPIVQTYWYKWLQAGPMIKKIRKRNEKVYPELRVAEQELAEQIVQKNIVENDLSLLPNLDELREEKKALQKDIMSLLESSKLADADRRINTFNDGYAKGQTNRTEMTDDEYEDYRSSTVRQMRNVQDDKVERSPKVYRNNGLRPHQALRKAITNDFNQN